MWKRSQSSYGKTPVPDTPYQRAKQVVDDRLGSALVRGKNWRLPGSDAQGFAGLKDKVDKHTWQFIKGAALSSLLSIGSELASDDGDRLTRALQNAGQDTANIAGQRIIDRNLNVQPTLKVRPGWRFNVIVSRDLILKPYGD